MVNFPGWSPCVEFPSQSFDTIGLASRTAYLARYNYNLSLKYFWKESSATGSNSEKDSEAKTVCVCVCACAHSECTT